MREVAEVLAEALWARLRSLWLAADRLDRLPENRGVESPEVARPDLLAREFVLRLLRVAADPVNYAIARRLTEQPSVALTELATSLGLPRLAVMERVADLVQVNLAARSLVGDQVNATAATAALVELVEAVEQALVERMGRELGRVL